MRLDGITACVFDAYGTLFDVRAPAHAGGLVSADKAGVLADLWRRKQLEYTWLRTLMGRHEDFWRVTGDALDHALGALGLDADRLRGPLLDAYRAPPAFAEVARVLGTLRTAGMRHAILSNGTPTMLASAVAGLDQSFDDVLSVEAIGVFKPHPMVYRLACERFGAAPEAIAYLSSNAWDVAGGAAFGFRAVWVNRTGQPSERLPGAPMATIRTLEGLLPLLGLATA